MWELIAPLLGQVLDKVIPDPVAAANAKLKFMELEQAGALEELKATTGLQMAQLDVDKDEAQSADPAQHWRGYLGFVCVFAYAWNFVVLPIATFATLAAGHPLSLPSLDATPLYTLTTGMLGLGTLHAVQSTITAIQATKGTK